MRKGMLIFTVGAIAVMAAGCAKDDAGKNIGGETTEVISTGTLETEKTVSTKDSAAIDNESTSDTKKDVSDSQGEETANGQEPWEIADGGYDVQVMSDMRQSYDEYAQKLLKIENAGVYGNVREVQAECKTGDDIIVYSADDIALIYDAAADNTQECVLEWGDNSYTLDGVKEWAQVQESRKFFIVSDLDGDGQDELVIKAENGARGSLGFCFIDIVDGEVRCDFYKSADLLQYNVYNDFLFTYQVEGMTQPAVKDVRECLGADELEFYNLMGDKGWWNDEGQLLENPYINLMAGCTYECDFYNDMRESEEGCVIRIGMDINFEALSGPCVEVYSYYKFIDGKLELIGIR